MENKNKYIMLLSLATAAVIFLVLVTIFTYINSPNPDTYTPATRAVCGIIAFILIVLFFKIPEELNYKVMDFHLETPKYEQEMYDEASMQIFSIILILLMNIYFFVVFNTVPSSGVFFGICIGSTFRLFVKTRKYFSQYDKTESEEEQPIHYIKDNAYETKKTLSNVVKIYLFIMIGFSFYTMRTYFKSLWVENFNCTPILLQTIAMTAASFLLFVIVRKNWTFKDKDNPHYLLSSRSKQLKVAIAGIVLFLFVKAYISNLIFIKLLLTTDLFLAMLCIHLFYIVNKIKNNPLYTCL